MSHKAITTVERFDADALRETFLELNAKVEANGTWVAFDRAQSTPCDFVVPHLGNEHLMGNRMWSGGVGFSREGDKLVLVMDDLDKQRPQVAAFLKEFKRCYTEKAAANLLAAYGYRVTKLDDGTYRATATAKTVAALSRQQTQAPTRRVQRVRF